MDWLDEKAIDLASQASAQLIALGVAVLALIAAWRVAAEGRLWQRVALKLSWLSYFASLLAGMWFLLALTGTVGSEEIPGVSLWNSTSGATRASDASWRCNFRTKSRAGPS